MTAIPNNEPCGLCGEPARGWAFAGGVRLCHGKDQRISCYVRWTVYGERATEQREGTGGGRLED